MLLCWTAGEGQTGATHVARVTLRGAESLTAAERSGLEAKLRGTTDRPDWLAGLEKEGKQWLADQGFAKAEIALTLDEAAQSGDVAVTANVKEGRRFKVAQIYWSGDSALSLDELQGALLLKPGDAFRRGLLLRSVELLKSTYADHGYTHAVLIPQWQLFPDEGVVSVYFDVRPGKREFAAAVSSSRSNSNCGRTRKTAKVIFPITSYDATRDAQADLAAARREAARSARKILVNVGGSWCGWCRVLDEAFQKNADLRSARDRYYVALHIHYGEKNRNECALRELPEAKTYPMVYVLDQTGGVLHANDTTAWQYAGGYDPARVQAFLEEAAKGDYR